MPLTTYAPCPAESLVGGFEILLAEEYTSVNGQVSDGVVPASVPDEVATNGQCTLWRAKVLFCDPACVPGETCGFEGSCIPYPETHSVGTVMVDGLTAEVSMDAKWGNHYTHTGTLPHPGFQQGDPIVLTAAGGDYEPFALRGYGVDPLTASAEKLTLSPGEGVSITWTPAATAGPTKIHLELNINNHGATSAWISCEMDDIGEGVIPGDLLSQLFEIGTSGFPSLGLSRRSVDSITITPGCVELVVLSEQGMWIDVEGVTSCTSDQQCPPGQSCGVDLSCHDNT